MKNWMNVPKRGNEEIVQVMAPNYEDLWPYPVFM